MVWLLVDFFVRNADCELSMTAPLPEFPVHLKTVSSCHLEGDVVYKDGAIWFAHANGPLIDVCDIPLSMNGAAVHNIENAMMAAILAKSLGINDDSIVTGLTSVKADAAHSRGRSNLVVNNGRQFFVDFAHNEDGLRRVVEMALKMPAKRRFLLLVKPAIEMMTC